MADNLNLQNNPTDQPSGAMGGGTSLTPAPAKSPLEEAGVEASENPTSQPTADIQTPAPAAPVAPTVTDAPVAPTSDLDQVNSASTPAPAVEPAPITPISDSPIPSGAPDPSNMSNFGSSTGVPAAQPEPSQATPTVDPTVSVNEPKAEDTANAATEDMGEPSEAPDTDQFLQSILDSKSPASQEAAVSEATPAPEMPASPTTDLASTAPAEPATSEAATSPAPAESPFSIPQPSPSEPAPALSELANDAPAQPAQPVSSPGASDAGSAPSIDSLTSTTSPMTDTPGQSAAADIFSKSQSPKKSPAKLILMVLLIAAVLGGVYYAAKTYFFSGNSKTVDNNSLQVTPTPSQSAVALSGDSARKADLKAIQQALLNLYSSNGKYPVSADYIKLNQAGNVVEKELVPNYLGKLPADPDTTRAYQYKSDGTTFTLTAVLDSTTDAGVVMEGGVALYKVDQSTDVAYSTSETASSTTSTTSTTTGSGEVSASTLDTTSSTATETEVLTPDSSDLF